MAAGRRPGFRRRRTSRSSPRSAARRTSLHDQRQLEEHRIVPRASSKTRPIFYRKVIGECYDLLASYNEDLEAVQPELRTARLPRPERGRRHRRQSAACAQPASTIEPCRSGLRRVDDLECCELRRAVGRRVQFLRLLVHDVLRLVDVEAAGTERLVGGTEPERVEHVELWAVVGREQVDAPGRLRRNGRRRNRRRRRTWRLVARRRRRRRRSRSRLATRSGVGAVGGGRASSRAREDQGELGILPSRIRAGGCVDPD